MKIVKKYDINADLTNEEQVRKGIKQQFGVMITGFNSVDEAKEFANKFPKYVKLNACKFMVNKGICDFSISNTNKVTGEVNETGIKRIEGFIKTLKKINMI